MHTPWDDKFKIGSSHLIRMQLKRENACENSLGIFKYVQGRLTLYRFKNMTPIRPSASYRFVSMVRDRPPYPLVYRWRHSICFCLDGSTPSKYPPQNQKSGFRLIFVSIYWNIGVDKKWNRAWMGSGWIQTGSYFGKMTPRGSGSFY